jgi:hypothetical protein
MFFQTYLKYLKTSKKYKTLRFWVTEQGRRKQVKVGGAQAFKALFHTKRAPSSKFIFG